MGFDLDDEKMYNLVKMAYSRGKHRSNAYIKHSFNKTIKFIHKEFDCLYK